LQQKIPWIDKSQSLLLPDNGLLEIIAAQQGIAKAVWQQNSVEVSYRQGSEKIALPWRNGRHSLKKLYQEAGIAPWLREAMPLIYINNELAAVADHYQVTIRTDFYLSRGFSAANPVCSYLRLNTDHRDGAEYYTPISITN
jgi:tRNA(Ile)-lysidine synthase